MVSLLWQPQISVLRIRGTPTYRSTLHTAGRTVLRRSRCIHVVMVLQWRHGVQHRPLQDATLLAWQSSAALLLVEQLPRGIVGGCDVAVVVGSPPSNARRIVAQETGGSCLLLLLVEQLLVMMLLLQCGRCGHCCCSRRCCRRPKVAVVRGCVMAEGQMAARAVVVDVLQRFQALAARLANLQKWIRGSLGGATF